MSNKTTAQAQNIDVRTQRERDLEDGIVNTFLAIERAKYLIDDMTDEYFNNNNEKDKDDQLTIIYGFDKYRAYSELISHSLWEACDLLQKLGASRF
ncbi:MAG: hypothetical protein E7547_09120 [Ruminococcaceae bacterium]|nr:hypothetical protein [Oscillospiraceae bacterium]